MRHDCLLLSGYNWLAALLIVPHHLVLDWLSSLWWFSFPLHSPNLLLVLTREKGWLLGCWIQTSPGEVVWSPLFGGSLFSMGLLLPLDLWLLLWGWWEKSPPTCACGSGCLWRPEAWGLPLAAWESAWGWHGPLSTFFLRVLVPGLWSD